MSPKGHRMAARGSPVGLYPCHPPLPPPTLPEMATPRPDKAPSTGDRPPQTTLAVAAAAIAAAVLGFESIRHGWLPPLTAYAWFGALELVVLVFTLGLMRRAVARRARELAGAQADLRAATKVNALLASVAQHMPNAVIIADREGQILWTNAACDKMSGFPHDESVRQPLAEFMGAIINGLASEETQILIERGTRAALVSKDTAPDGRIRWFSITFQPVHNAAGDLVNFIVLIDDFTAVREAHQRHSEEIAIQVSRMAQVGAWEYLVPTHEMRWEPELYRICQVELGHRPTLENMAGFFPAEHAATFLGNVRTAVAEGRAFDMECPLVTALGSQRWVQVFGWPEVDAAKAIRLVGTLQDTTARHAAESDRRTMEGQLFQLQKMETLGALAGGIAHDFNNLLAVVTGYAGIASMNTGDKAILQKSLGEIIRASQRASGLVSQILTFSRKAEVNFAPMDLNQLVRDLVALLSETFPRMIDFRTELQASLPPLLADQNQLQQVLLNLCVNARDAMPTGGILSVKTVLKGKGEVTGPRADPNQTYACLIVTDTGVGMPPEVCSRIFEPFFTTKEVDKGTGLGLSVVYGIVAAHHGFITVESTPGAGSAFTIYIPTAESAPIPQPPAVSRDFPAGAEAILVVDDETALRELLRMALTRKGYRVTGARDGLEAIETIARPDCPLDAILLDLNMPGATGLDVLKVIRAMRPGLKVMVMSGNFKPDVREEIESLGVTSIVEKPYTLDEMGKQLRHLLDS